MSGPLVVVDTGVVIAHLTATSERNPNGKILHACGAGSLRVALSDNGLKEVVEVLKRPKIQRHIKSASRAFVAAMDLWSHGTLYHPTRFEWPSVVDHKDHWVLDLAWEAEADFIIAIDPHLTRPTMPFPIEVLSPDELLARFLPGI